MEQKEGKAPEQVEQIETKQGIGPNAPTSIDPAFQRVLDAKKNFTDSIMLAFTKFAAETAIETQEQAVAEREFIAETNKNFVKALDERLSVIMFPTFFNVVITPSELIPENSGIFLVNQSNVKGGNDGEK